MRLGIFAKTFPGSNPAQVLFAAAAAGYDAVQYNMACSGLSSLPLDIPPAAIAEIVRARQDTGVEIVAVSATYNMVHPDPERRRAGRYALAAIAAAAGDIGAPMVTICTGSRDADNQWHAHPDNRSDAAWADMMAEFEAIVPICDAAGVTIGIEPELANVIDSPKRARKLLDAFPGGPLRIVMDAANLFEEGDADARRAAIDEAVDLLGPEVALAHAKDRTAGGDFATAGSGVIDWPHYIAALRRVGFDGTLITHGLTADEAPETLRFLQAQLAHD